MISNKFDQTQHNVDQQDRAELIKSQSSNFLDIHDFSTATHWEKLIHELSDEMKEIRQKIHELNHDFVHCKVLETVGYEKYELLYIHSFTANEKNNSVDLFSSCEHVNNHHLTQWFQTRNMLIVRPAAVVTNLREFDALLTNVNNLTLFQRQKLNESDAKNNYSYSGSGSSSSSGSRSEMKMNSVDCKMILSALSMAAYHCQMNVPCFICLDGHLLEYEGMWRHCSDLNVSENESFDNDFGDGDDGDGDDDNVFVMKLNSQVLKRDQSISSMYTTVNGLYDLFCLLISGSSSGGVGHVPLSHVTLRAKYTHTVPVSMDKWVLYCSAESVKMGTRTDPIRCIQVSYLYKLGDDDEKQKQKQQQLDTINQIQKLTDLPTKMAHSCQVKCHFQSMSSMTIMASVLRKFIDYAFMPMMVALNSPTQSSSDTVDHYQYIMGTIDPDMKLDIEARIDHILHEHNGDDVLQNQNQESNSNQKIEKSFDRKHLMGLFSRDVLLYFIESENWTCVIHMWKILVSNLRRYWEWSQSVNSSDVGTSEPFVIAHCSNQIDISDDLIAQKLDMLNICCLAQVKHNLSREERVHIDDDEHQAWGDDITGEGDDIIETDENVVKEIVVYGNKTIKVPVTQQVPPKTEDMVAKEMELIELITDPTQRAMYQCASVLSDIQAFKFVNSDRGDDLSFRDFLGWYSPNDVLPDGTISTRMDGDNLWRTIWEQAKPVALKQQKPLFNFEEEAEKVCHELETMEPSKYLLHITKAVFVWAVHCLTDVVSDFCGSDERSVPATIQTVIAELKQKLRQLLVDGAVDANSSESQSSISRLFDSFIEKYHEAEWLVSVYASLEYHLVNEQYSPSERFFIEQILSQGSLATTDVTDEDLMQILHNLSQRSSSQQPVKEFVFGARAPRPFYNSPKSSQLMHVLHKSDEFRISTALSESLPY